MREITIHSQNESQAWMDAYSFFGYGASIRLIATMWGAPNETKFIFLAPTDEL